MLCQRRTTKIEFAVKVFEEERMDQDDEGMPTVRKRRRVNIPNGVIDRLQPTALRAVVDAIYEAYPDCDGPSDLYDAAEYDRLGQCVVTPEGVEFER